jgi:transposase-like protein
MKEKEELNVDEIDKLLEASEKVLKLDSYKQEKVQPVEKRCPHCNSKNIRLVSSDDIGDQFECNDCGVSFGIVSDNILT